jgi:hypothetical protein
MAWASVFNNPYSSAPTTPGSLPRQLDEIYNQIHLHISNRNGSDNRHCIPPLSEHSPKKYINKEKLMVFLLILIIQGVIATEVFLWGYSVLGQWPVGTRLQRVRVQA